MTGPIAGLIATFTMLAYTGYLTWRAGSLALGLITGLVAVLALVDLWQTEFQRRENSRRRG